MIIDIRLEILVENFLYENYYFRKLDIYDFFDNSEENIKWINKGVSPDISYIDTCKEPCEFLDNNTFGDWINYNKHDLDSFAEEFRFKNFSLNIKASNRKIKSIIEYLITNTKLTKTINFNPLIKELINEGRYKVSKQKPLTWDSSNRIEIQAEEKNKYYICRKDQAQLMANPCYIIRKNDTNNYRIIYFVNLDRNCRYTNKTKINAWAFTTALPTEIGLTPEQAIRQRQN